MEYYDYICKVKWVEIEVFADTCAQNINAQARSIKSIDIRLRPIPRRFDED